MGCIMVPATKLSQKKIHTEVEKASWENTSTPDSARGTSQMTAR